MPTSDYEIGKTITRILHLTKNHNHIDNKLCWIDNSFVNIGLTRYYCRFDNYIVAASDDVELINTNFLFVYKYLLI